jgi:hypothetical protein
MRARLHSIFSPDVDRLGDWAPASPGFAVTVRLMIGPDPGEGEESFDVTICNATWLAGRAAREGVVDVRHHVVVESFDWSKLRSYFERQVRACSGTSWDEVAERLARFAYWEFEDYQP